MTAVTSFDTEKCCWAAGILHCRPVPHL